MSKSRLAPKQRLVLAVALLVFAWGVLLLIGRLISPNVQDFLEAASPWVLMALGLAGWATYESIDGKEASEKGRTQHE